MTLVLGFGNTAREGALDRPRRPAQGLRAAPPRATRAGWHAYLDSLKRRGRPRRRPFATDLRRVGDDARRARGQDAPRRLRRLAEHAVGVRPGPREAVVRLPPGVVARPLPDRHRAARGRRQRGRRARARLPVRQAADARRLLPPELEPSTAPSTGTNLQLDEVALPIVLAWQLGRARRQDLRERQARGRLHPRQGSADPAGALGEPERLVTRHDRLRDRGAGVRGRPRARQRRPRLGRGVGGEGGRVAGKVDGWTRHVERPVLRRPLLPAPEQARRPERGHDLRHRRLRARPRSTSARSPTRASSSSCASGSSAPTTRSCSTRSASSTAASPSTRPHGRFWHRFDFDGYGEKKDGSRWDFDLPTNPTEHWAKNKHDRADLADLRGRARRVRAGGRAVGGGARAAGRDGERRRRGPHDPRAGLGPVPRRRDRPGFPKGLETTFGLAADVVARAVPAARAVDRRRSPGRAALRGRVLAYAG